MYYLWFSLIIKYFLFFIIYRIQNNTYFLLIIYTFIYLFT